MPINVAVASSDKRKRGVAAWWPAGTVDGGDEVEGFEERLKAGVRGWEAEGMSSGEKCREGPPP